MPRVYVMVGIPASGKSTWARDNLPGCDIVSTDALREELFGSAEVARGQGIVFETAHRRLAGLLRGGRDVVFDATNTRPAYRRSLLKRLWAEGLEFEAVAVVMEATPERALSLQQGRTRKVPAHVIRRFHQSLVPPTEAEGFAEIRFVHSTPVQPSETN